MKSEFALKPASPKEVSPAARALERRRERRRKIEYGQTRVVEVRVPVGVPARWIHGAGDLERMTVAPRTGGGDEVLSSFALWSQRTPKTASSSALPFSKTGSLLSSSSSLSVFSSSPSSASSNTGRQISKILSATIIDLLVSLALLSLIAGVSGLADEWGGSDSECGLESAGAVGRGRSSRQGKVALRMTEASERVEYCGKAPIGHVRGEVHQRSIRELGPDPTSTSNNKVPTYTR
ncbi:hypothetical protein KC349_g152 [Hortaea werneckii]|nr:hypothetical protein KC349_g152 [Hortaea werneckii]